MTGVFVGGEGESAGGGEVFVGATVGFGVSVGSDVRVGSLGVLVAVLGTAVVAVGGLVVPLGSEVAVGEPVAGSEVVVSVVGGPGVWLPSGVGDMEEVGLGVAVLTTVVAVGPTGVLLGRGVLVGSGAGRRGSQRMVPVTIVSFFRQLTRFSSSTETPTARARLLSVSPLLIR